MSDTHTHFDIGFAVNSVPRSKRAMEQKGGKVRRKVLFNKGLRSLRSSTAHDTAVAKRTARLIGRKRFWEVSCKDHEPKNGEVESQLSQKFSQVHSGASSTASAPTGTLFVGRAVPVVSRPPAC